jgi:hypothetical protein
MRSVIHRARPYNAFVELAVGAHVTFRAAVSAAATFPSRTSRPPWRTGRGGRRGCGLTGPPDAGAGPGGGRAGRRTVNHPHRETHRTPHAVVTGKPDASKGARPVWAGGRWKRTRAPHGHLASGLPVLRHTGRIDGPAEPVATETVTVVLVRVGLVCGSVVIEVWDNSTDAPVLNDDPLDTDAEGGRGLFLVRELSKDWGCWFPPRGGKWVWAAAGPEAL